MVFPGFCTILRYVSSILKIVVASNLYLSMTDSRISKNQCTDGLLKPTALAMLVCSGFLSCGCRVRNFLNHFRPAIFFSLLNKWKTGALFFAAIWKASSYYASSVLMHYHPLEGGCCNRTTNSPSVRLLYKQPLYPHQVCPLPTCLARAGQ